MPFKTTSHSPHSMCRPTMERTRVVLLLAHEGVAQPAAWEAWEALGGRVAVHCPESVARRPFEKSRRVLDNFGPTEWGDLSLVRETLLACAALCDAHGDDVLIALASGDSIPVAPPSVLWERLGDETAVFKRPPLTIRVRKADDKVVTVTTKVAHGVEQWFVAAGRDVRRALSVFENERALDATLVAGFADGIPFPDNFFLLYAVGEDRVKVNTFLPVAHAVADTDRLSVETARTLLDARLFGFRGAFASPIVWKNLDEPIYSEFISRRVFCVGVQPIDGDEGIETDHVWSLRLLLLTARLHEHGAFMRKVSDGRSIDPQFIALLFSDNLDELERRRALEEERLRLTSEHVLAAREAEDRAVCAEVRRQNLRGNLSADAVVDVGVGLCGNRIFSRLLPRRYRRNPARAARLLVAVMSSSVIMVCLIFIVILLVSDTHERHVQTALGLLLQAAVLLVNFALMTPVSFVPKENKVEEAEDALPAKKEDENV